METQNYVQEGVTRHQHQFSTGGTPERDDVRRLGDGNGATEQLIIPRQPPRGFVPMGTSPSIKLQEAGAFPQTPDELEELNSYSYVLSVSAALDLKIPVAGGVTGGFDRRVIVQEWSRSARVPDQKGVEYLYGFAIRFCLTVSSAHAELKFNLPYLSAQASLGALEASWIMQVRGLTGPKIDKAALPPGELKVETYVLAQQSITNLVNAISDPSTKFVPGVVLAKIEPENQETLLWLSSVKALALYNVSRGKPAAEVMAMLGTADGAANDTITDVYRYFGVQSGADKPGDQSRDAAKRILHGISVDV